MSSASTQLLLTLAKKALALTLSVILPIQTMMPAIAAAEALGGHGETGGSGIDCTLPGKIGKACWLNGIDDFADLGPDYGAVAPGEPFSLGVWVQPISLGGAVRTVLSRMDGTRGWVLELDEAGQPRFIMQSDPDNYRGARGSALTRGNWHFLAVSWDGQEAALYVDGRPAPQHLLAGTLGAITPDTSLYAGKRPDGGNPFHGLIDEVQVFQGAIPETEVALLYRQQWFEGGAEGIPVTPRDLSDRFLEPDSETPPQPEVSAEYQEPQRRLAVDQTSISRARTADAERLADRDVEEVRTGAPANRASGYSAGQFRVGESGAAVYEMPITVAPGTSGVQPELGLAYSSQGRDGLLGLGWSLQGLSAVTRCPANLAKDGFSDGVDFDADDRYCLDGQRLVAVAGSYGADGTEYRPEKDPTKRVISRGQSGRGPASFEVRTKAGLVMQYAGTADSRIEAAGRSDASVITWALNRVSDTLGNYFAIHYDEDSAQGTFRPRVIRWTGNDLQGLAPYASVVFDYEDRPEDGDRAAREAQLENNQADMPIEPASAFVGGARVRTDKRLAQVTSYYGNQVVRQYRLGYANGGLVHASHLVQISECDGDDEQAACFAPTRFEWAGLPAAGEADQSSVDIDFVRFDTLALDGPRANDYGIDASRFKYGDFNGDGRTDVYMVRGFGSAAEEDLIFLATDEKDRERFYRPSSTRAGLVTKVPRADSGDPKDQSPDIALARIKLGDFNGDGRTDILKVRGWHYESIVDPNEKQIARAHARGGECRISNGLGLDVGETPYLVGRYALVCDRAKKVVNEHLVYFGREDGSLSDPVLSQVTHYVSNDPTEALLDIERLRLGDFDGDGKTDLYFIEGWGATQADRIRLSAGDGTFPKSLKIDGPRTHVSDEDGYTGLSYARIQFGDFNGDGKTDVYRIRGTGLEADDEGNLDIIHLSNGDGTWGVLPGIKTWIGRSAAGSNGIPSDKIKSHKAKLCTNDNQASACPEIVGMDLARIQFGDFNGDGKADIYHIRGMGGSGQDRIYLSRGNGAYDVIPGRESYVSSGIESTPLDLARIKIADFNGDGKSDIYRVRGFDEEPGDGSPKDNIWLSWGNGRYTVVNGRNSVVGVDDGPGYFVDAHRFISALQPADFNGDGRADLVRYDDAAKAIRVILQLRKGYDPKGNLDRTDWILPDLMTAVVAGNGARTEVQYLPLNDRDVYTREDYLSNSAQAVNPDDEDGEEGPATDFVNFQNALYLVRGYSVDNGVGGRNQVHYRYFDAKMHREGLGFVGFAKVETRDEGTGLVQTTVYHGEDPAPDDPNQPAAYGLQTDFVGMPKWTITRVEPEGQAPVLLSKTTNDFARIESLPGVVFSYVKESRSVEYEPNTGLPTKSTRVTSTYDSTGNLIEAITDHGNGYGETVTNSYSDDLDRWHLGRLVRTTVEKRAPGVPASTRTSAFAYDPDTGLLNQEVIEPDVGGTVTQRKRYWHDRFGNILRSAVIAQGTEGAEETRNTYTLYDPFGRFVVGTANDLGHHEVTAYDPRTGNRIAHRGPNGIETAWEYDGFGRKLRELRADGTETSLSYAACDMGAECPAGAVHAVTTESTGQAPATLWFDLLDREIQGRTLGQDGTPILTRTVYDARGRKDKTSEPHFEGEDPLWTRYVYDAVGRPIEVILPGERATSTDYQGLITTVTNPKGQQSTRQVNVRGELIRVTEEAAASLRAYDQALAADDIIDGAENTTTYQYDAEGNLVLLTDAAGNTTAITYDQRGRKTRLDDPDAGTTVYRYNGFGEIIGETDALGRTAENRYDPLGRLITQTIPEGTRTWTYDLAANGIGKLAGVEDSAGYREAHTYDPLGRPIRSEVHSAGETFTAHQHYDEAGRVSREVYPTGFSVLYRYNDLGYQTEVLREQDGQLLWQAGARDARGNLTEQYLGNGLTTRTDFVPETGFVSRIRTGLFSEDGSIQDLGFAFDALGNLSSRTDNSRGLTEDFGYDALNRLVSAELHNAGIADDAIDAGISAGSDPIVTVRYDVLGNIRHKSDVGDYSYGIGAGPHAVGRIRDGPRDFDFTYDAVGNQTSNGERVITYSSFNKPLRIAHANGTVLEFDHGPGNARYVQRSYLDGSLTRTKHYAGRLYEKQVSDGLVKHLHYIFGPAGLVATYTVANGQPSLAYVHKDHLGSIQSITDQDGALVETLSYDPWGLRRDADTWLPETTEPEPPELDRGFTGHEHLDAVELVHMNGRVYDPVVGRMLNPDPFVQAPEMGQNLNRYTYVINNPLSITDPSGYFFALIFAVAAAFVAKISAAVLAMGAYLVAPLATLSWEKLAYLALTRFAMSFAQSLVSGQGVGDAFASGAIAAATAVLSSGVTSYTDALRDGANAYLAAGVKLGRSAARGVVSGLGEKLRGGSFVHSFSATAITEVTMTIKSDYLKANVEVGKDSETKATLGKLDIRVARVLVTATAGGTIAKIGGGKFVNGAATAATFSAINEVYEGVTGFGATADSGNGTVDREDGRAVEGRNTIGKHCTPDKGCGKGVYEGSLISRILNAIPGLNAVSSFHDNLQDSLGPVGSHPRKELNVLTMLPSAALTYAAIYGQSVPLGAEMPSWKDIGSGGLDILLQFDPTAIGAIWDP